MVLMGLIKRKNILFFLWILLVSGIIPLAANPPEALSLSAEISRLERASLSQNSQERFQAFLSLARLQRLAGDSEAALRAYDGALALSPSDGQTLLEQGRLLMSLGEHERAALAFSSLLAVSRDRELLIQGSYLAAQLDAFRSGNTHALAALADNNDFISHRSGIYYTLWKLSDDTRWKNRLVAEFPQSPEARIALSGAELQMTPLWIFFPGRESLSIAGPVTQAPPAAPPQPAPPPSASGPAVFLQTGLYSREANALARAEQLSRAGFQPQIIQRRVNNADHWAVGVQSGSDMNALIRQLREAGFEAFPVR